MSEFPRYNPEKEIPKEAPLPQPSDSSDVNDAGDFAKPTSDDQRISLDEAQAENLPSFEWTDEDQRLLEDVQRLRLEQEIEIQKDAAGLDTELGNTDSTDAASGHAVPSTILEGVDTVIDEQNAMEIAQQQGIRKPAGELPNRNLQGLVYEGMYQRVLEDEAGPENVVVHPSGLTLADGRRIEPDFAVTNDEGQIQELHDAKGFFRKDVRNAQPAAGSVTHFSNLEKASRYAQVDSEGVSSVHFGMPDETARLDAVQEEVAEFGDVNRPVTVESVGTEAEIKQRMTDLRMSPEDRFALSESVEAEIARIQALPEDKRQQAVGDLMFSLQDKKGDETNEGRNIRWATRVEREGKGITIIDPETKKEYTIWYRSPEE